MKWLEYLQDKYNTYRGGLGLVSGKKYINYSTRYFKSGKRKCKYFFTTLKKCRKSAGRMLHMPRKMPFS